MAFRTLQYQIDVLDGVSEHVAALREAKEEADDYAAFQRSRGKEPTNAIDFTATAWEKTRTPPRVDEDGDPIPFSPRHDGTGAPVPNATLKVPTGGGKTFLAVHAVSRIMGGYLQRRTGFVLWIVPNEAIYTQTMRALRTRSHPYRLALDQASGNRTRIMEKGDPLHALDVEGQLCVMVLMLQSANRQTKEVLRLFRDRGDVHGFFPADGDMDGHAALIDQVPNLDRYDDYGGLVKHSLGNALRVIRPIVVMDEGQKATSELATDTLYGFNPSYVLELTATPKDVKPKSGPAHYANVLREITGARLHEAGMIKMPLNIDAREGVDWESALRASLDRLNTLQAASDEHRAATGVYIRPIMLVQVERTGDDQRDGENVHAEDAREWLKRAGLDDAEIAVKTAQTNELASDENRDLLSPINRVRAIITRDALREGWDCPFAYVLCSLAAVQARSAMTQLVGRILRQPHAEKTGVDALDEAYVITHRAVTASVVEAVKKGLEGDGLADLAVRLVGSGDAGRAKGAKPITLKRREGMEGTIALPKVLVVEDDGVRPLDYETDILAAIDWRDYDPASVADEVPKNRHAATRQLVRVRTDDEGRLVDERVAANDDATGPFDRAYAARAIDDLVPNPFVAHAIVSALENALEAQGFDADKRGRVQTLATERLRKALDAEQDARGERVFRDGIKAGRIQFRLRADDKNWTMPERMIVTTPTPDTPLTYEGHLARKSVFEPVFQAEFDNDDERKVAVYLDADDALAWWHRAVARTSGGYPLQGWRPNRVWPDFVFASDRNGTRRLVALETKGDHLDGSEDSTYKRALMKALSEAFASDATPAPGTLAVTTLSGATVECAFVKMSDWNSEVPALIG